MSFNCMLSLRTQYSIGMTFTKQTKNYAKAEEALETGLAYVVNNPGMKAEFLSQLAEAQFGLKKLETAVKNYREASALAPQNNLFKN